MNPFEEAVEWAKSAGLYPLISLYVQKDSAKQILKRASPSDDVDFREFTYYAYPEDEVVVNFVANNWVPPRVFLLEGTVRLSFMARSYRDLLDAVSKKEEDDVVVTAKEGKLYLTKRRVFYMDFRSVNELQQNEALKLLGHTLLSTLKISIIANNVAPGKNRVKLYVNGDEVEFEVLEGRLSKEEIEAGKFLTRAQLEALKKDLKAVNPEDVKAAILAKYSV